VTNRTLQAMQDSRADEMRWIFGPELDEAADQEPG
jgi:hypothetical protein